MLETDRLLLRPLRASDAVMQRQLWSERGPRVPAHRRISADGHPTLEELQERIRTGFRGHSLGLLAIEQRSTGEVIGCCGLLESSHFPTDEPEIAFELLHDRWGRGYATEAARAVVEWADAGGVPRLWATVREWNTASRRVLATLGFVETDRVQPDPEHGDTLFITRAHPELVARDC